MKFAAAILETGDSFLHLESTEVNQETTEDIDGREQYSDYRKKAQGLEEKVPDYFTAAETLMENPFILYHEELLRPEAYSEAEKNLEALKQTAGRKLSDSEKDSVVKTAMKETEAFPRKAIDKEELVDRLYIDVYDERPDSLKLRRKGLSNS
jgi:hypothetical protein